MALGLHYMHASRVLHRDLKTQNIFLLGNGRLVLGDLGVSKVLEGTMDFAQTSVGTPYYMSPEIFKNKPYNHKSDIWALGCVLYEMTTLNRPFDANSLNALAIKIVKGRYPPISSRYTRSLNEVIAAMLSTNPSGRPDLEDLLRKPLIKRHTQDLIADIVSRPQAAIGEGTMVVRAAAVNVVAERDPTGGQAPLMKGNRDVEALKKQLEGLGLHDVIAKALAPKERLTSAHRAEKAAVQQASALQREEDRKRLVEDALGKLRQEHEDRIKHRQRARERAGIAPRPGGGGGGGNAAAARARPASSAARDARR